MDFKWHDEKREANIEKHDIDFPDAVQVFQGRHFVEDQTREEDGEREELQSVRFPKTTFQTTGQGI